MKKGTHKNYCNILLLGCDVIDDILGRANPTEKQKCMRSDAMVVASLNRKNGEIRLVSLMRDIWVSIPGKGMGKLNAPVVYGGPELAVEVINASFDFGIEKYIMININDMIDFVDSIGGIDLEITDEEAEYIDEWMPNVRIVSKRDDEVESLKTGGLRHLNGMQTVAHARNRSIGYMIGRENRINDVIKALANKMKNEYSYPEAIRIGLRSLKYVKTNITIPQAMGLALFGLKAKLKDIKTYHAPEEGTYEIKRDGVWRMEVDFEKATAKINDFLYEG